MNRGQLKKVLIPLSEMTEEEQSQDVKTLAENMLSAYMLATVSDYFMELCQASLLRRGEKYTLNLMEKTNSLRLKQFAAFKKSFKLMGIDDALEEDNQNMALVLYPILHRVINPNMYLGDKLKPEYENQIDFISIEQAYKELFNRKLPQIQQ